MEEHEHSWRCVRCGSHTARGCGQVTSEHSCWNQGIVCVSCEARVDFHPGPPTPWEAKQIARFNDYGD